MPARKKRPGKHGTGQTETALAEPFTGLERELIGRLKLWEREAPFKPHYVGWDYVEAAHKLAKRGLIAETWLTMHYRVTPMFRRTFGAS